MQLRTITVERSRKYNCGTTFRGLQNNIVNFLMRLRLAELKKFVHLSADVQTNMGLVTGVAAAGGVFLFLAIALAVVVVRVKKRFKGALADRNRVYAMEQFSKYAKEEKDNDGFARDDDVNESGEQNFNKNAST